MNQVTPTPTLDDETFHQLSGTIRRFVRERLVPLEAEVARNDLVPPSIVEEMRALGLFGLAIPQEYGGLGLSMFDEARIVFELGWASPAFRSAVGTNIGIGSQGILIGGTQDQKNRYLSLLAAGEIIGAFALTEPEAGSDIRSISTRARHDGDGYVINGTKRYITNGPSAHLFTVFAKTENTDGRDTISAFLVEGDTPGLSRGKPEMKMGQQGAHVCDIRFDDCRVPADALLGGAEGKGVDTLHRVLTRGRLHIAALCVGISERLIDECVSYASTRRQFGKAIGDFQLVQAMLADSKVESYAARCMVLDAARKVDGACDVSLYGPCCKLFASEMVGRVADRAVQVFGGAGYMTEYGIERFYRDVRLFRIFEGTSEIQRLIIGRGVMKATR